MSAFGFSKFSVASKVGAVAVSALALGGGVAFVQNVNDNNSKDVAKALTYDSVAPYVKDFLTAEGLLTDEGLVIVPGTGEDPETRTVEEVVLQLLDEGAFDYLQGQDGRNGTNGRDGVDGKDGLDGAYAGKGDKGDTGATGATGPQGPAGQNGANGATGATGAKGDKGDSGVLATGSGLNLSGGTLTLKPCAIDEVLMVSSSNTWDCATVSASGVDTNTTNTSAALTLTGTSLTSKITDSAGNSVTSPALDLGATFATDAEATAAANSAITAANLGQYAKNADLSALTSRVSSLETRADDLEDSESDHEGRIASLETDVSTIKSSYVTSTGLTTALGGYYTKSQTYTQTEVDNLLAAKQATLPTCTDQQVIKYDQATTAWVCANDLNTTSPDLSNYATESWVTGQNYATTTALENLLPNNLLAGTGINLVNNNGVITVNSTAQTDVFEVVPDHTAVATPNANKIYVDTGTTPAEQWVYENSTWVKIGEVNATMTDYYTKTQTDNAISSAITANNSNYTTTSALNTSLATKQDKLPTCTDGQVIKYSLSSNTWACGSDNNTTVDLSAYATQTWVTGQITTNNNNYTTTTDLNDLLADKADQTALDATNTSLGTETTNRTSADTDLSDRLDTVEAAAGTYVPKSALNCSTTQALTGTGTNGTVNCKDITDLTTGTLVANSNLITANTLATSLTGYYTETEIDTMLGNYYKKTETYSKTEIDGKNLVTGTDQSYQIQAVTTLPATPNADTLYYVTGN